MAAYVIAQIEITDPVGYEEYKKMAERTVAAYGGRYLVRGGAVETLDGEWDPKRLVMLEFESVERAKEWWSSQEYAIAKELRLQTARSKMILAAGV